MAETTTERDGSRPNPPVLGSLAYLVMNLPIGIASFVFVVTSLSVGVGTAIIWVGVGILAVAMLIWRGAAGLERLRVHTMLGTYVATPYRPMPADGKKRWSTRLKDPATWKEMTYFLLLLPIGIAEFTMMVVLWSASLWFSLMPVYYTWFPGDWRAEVLGEPFPNVDSWFETLPWAGLGVLLLAMTIVLTKGLGTLHASYARAMLGPSPRRISRMEELSTAGAIDWSTEWPNSSANFSYRPVSR